MEQNKIYQGNCIEVLSKIPMNTVDLIYLDPPFYTQKKHTLTTKNNTKKYEFSDEWSSLDSYLDLIRDCLKACEKALKPSGSIFLHCDKAASHHIRILLDDVFLVKNFRSEIIWFYKRWSNSKKGLLNAHQTIYFYSKTSDFKFNTLYTDYSVTTNVDQILQDRERKLNGKSTYKKDESGKIILGKAKKGVPLSDVWEIPYLNPKAKERVGYPTQKPVLLLNQIIKIATNEGDLVLDPFCGSGTTCVAAKHLNRAFIGIDISADAVQLAEQRLEEMLITTSNLLKKGKKAYQNKSEKTLAILKSIGAFPVQRNSGIDGFLDQHYEGKPVPVKIQMSHESIDDAIEKLEKATKRKEYLLRIVIQTKAQSIKYRLFGLSSAIKIVKAINFQIDELKTNTLNITSKVR